MKRRREPDEDDSALWFAVGLLALTALTAVVAWYTMDGIAGLLNGLRGVLPW